VAQQRPKLRALRCALDRNRPLLRRRISREGRSSCRYPTRIPHRAVLVDRRVIMTWIRWTAAATGASALAMMAGSAQSAPLASAASDFQSVAVANVGFERVAVRVCWTRGGARQCRWVDNARIYGYRASRPSGYARPRVYGYRAPRVFGYAAPRIYGYAADPEYGYAASGVYYAGPPIVIRSYRPAMDYANPDQYPSGSPAWWSVMNRQGRGGRPD
jgi:hypothetical protein